MLPDGVIVEPIITIKDVDLSTGNLDIEGALTITGDVKPGMHVKATAAIVVEGVVEGGHVEAGGDVEVRGAIIGHGEPRSFDGEINPFAATIRTPGSVRAPFAENAVISAGSSIVLREFVMNSELNAGESILVGEPGSNKGRIINSRCRATGSIEAVTIGSRSGAGTILEVGIDPDVHARYTQAQHLHHIKERELDEAVKAVEYFREHPERTTREVVLEKEKTLARLTTEVQELSGQVRRLKKRFDQLENASITAARQVFAGVRITIGEQTIQLDNDLPGTTFNLGEDGMLHGSGQ